MNISGHSDDLYQRQERVKKKNKEGLERARRAIAVYGYTLAKAAEVAEVDERTVRRWKNAGLLGLGTTRKASDTRLWTAPDLQDIGLEPALAAGLVLLLAVPNARGHQRVREWLSRYSASVPKAPPEWAAAIAFLPIIAKDTQSPSLEDLGEAMDEGTPWENERLRKRYGRLAAPGDLAARSELANWVLAAGLTSPGGGPYDSPAVAAVAVMELLRRLPYIDRPKRRGWGGPINDVDEEFRGYSMRKLALSWCILVDSGDAWLSAPKALQRNFAKVALNHWRRRRRKSDHEMKEEEQP